jgi:cholestenol Delta-isomerase
MATAATMSESGNGSGNGNVNGKAVGADGTVSVSAAKFAEQASVSYGQALALAKDIRDPAALLILSLALAAVSNLAGRWVDSRVHISSGQRLLTDILRAGTSRTEVDSAAESLVRMDLQAISFSDSRAPYPFDGNSGDGCQPESRAGSNSPREADGPIHSISQAAMRIFDLLRRILIVAGRSIGDDAEFMDSKIQVALIGDQVAVWEKELERHLERNPPPPTQVDSNSAMLLTLKLYHATIRSILRAGIDGPETRWDDCIPHFERITFISAAIIRLTKTPTQLFVSLEPGIVIPLYASATRCRHPLIRRRAVALLRLANRQEGMWTSVGAAAVAEKIIMIEEENLGIELTTNLFVHSNEMDAWADAIAGENCEDWLRGDERWLSRCSWDGMITVPEGQRVLDNAAIVDADAKRVEMMLVFSDQDHSGQFRTRNAAVTF